MKNSRKFAVFLVMTLMLSLLTPMLSHLTGTNELVQAATLRLNKKSASIISGKTLTLKVIGLKKGYTVTWSSQNKSVATVSSKGVVTAIAPNKSTKIIATVKYNYKYKYKNRYKTKVKTQKLCCSIKTTYPPLERTLNVSKQLVGAWNNFELSVIDADPYDTITYSVNNPNIAYVDPYTGWVSARGNYGSTDVYADIVSSDGKRSCRLTCNVEIVPSSQARGLSCYSNYVEQFKEFNLYVTNASSVDYIEYESSDTNVATVIQTGTDYTTVVGRSIGTTYITAKIKKIGNVVETKSCRVVVKEYNKDRELLFDRTPLSPTSTLSTPLSNNQTVALTIENFNPLLDKVKYESLDKKVATVDATGLVKCVLKAGSPQANPTIKATITFPTGETAIKTITVPCR